MRSGFVDSIPSLDGGRIKVTRVDVPHLDGAVELAAPPVAVAHTTETKYLPGYRPNTPPHMTVGKRSATTRCGLFQHVGLSRMANALANLAGGTETNRLVRFQLEQCGFTSREPWLPADPEQRVITASLMEWVEDELGVPEHRPFPDTIGPGVWAELKNPRRLSGKFGKSQGWFTHLEVPENTHWDCGSEKLAVLLGMEPAPPLVDRWGLVATWDEDGHRHLRELVKPTTLRGVGLAMARGEAVRASIRLHKQRRHTVQVVKRAVPG